MAFTSPEALWSPSSTRSAVSSCPTALREVARATGSSGRCALQIVCFDLGPAGTPSSPRGAPHRAVLRASVPPATAAAVPLRPAPGGGTTAARLSRRFTYRRHSDASGGL
ncbi:hypothetical protein NDU88_008244 [Pleurodeles waltl]|uniref:Uncharacterized protein n=1 Tax=Pleurodeles waltl TaxID=8319 RepID=A0AAV7N957_PLEWA|nr:hypothetical protein NDU88_008244 [Pleurodeles waltl]